MRRDTYLERILKARVIPYRGSWVEFLIDVNEAMYINIDRRRKIPATILLRAIGFSRNNDVVLRRPHIADGNHEARLVIKMKSGVVHDVVLGVAYHLTGDEVVDKFRLNADATLGRERVTQTISLVQRLEKLKDVAELMDAVTFDGKKGSSGKTPSSPREKAYA